MADDAQGRAPKGIAALPPTTVRQIGSHQLLTDPSSVVKELIDNALDARAKSIFVDVTANTINSVQVKDDGHGIPSEDRALACRRYCTSKIRDFQDLKEVGGKWLGFRGEALASIADMSGTISITTRVEGEPVAVKLTYQRNGELTATECDSHPVGTTVKVTKLLETARVRKDLAVKSASKCLAKIRRLMQAYVLARPAVRFRLHVLKAKNNKGDLVYAPKANANVEDAALKIIGKECALQCDWTALGMDDFELQAFLPKPAAIGSKIANYGAFISVDSRPVSSVRGSLKKIAATVRDRLRKASATLASVKDPFFCLNIICPVDSYDPNIEPAKDDVIFGDENFIVAMVDRMLVSYYPVNINTAGTVEDVEDVVLPQPEQVPEVMKPLSRPHIPSSVHQTTPIKGTRMSDSALPSQPPRWRSSMYGMDEEDLEFLQENVPDVAEEEEGLRDVAISNPWTIARMNAPIKPRKPVSNGQLLSPAKSQGDTSTAPQSPAPAATSHQLWPVEPLTPLTPSQVNAVGDRVNTELQQSVQRLPGLVSLGPFLPDHRSSPNSDRARELPSFEDRMSLGFVQPVPRVSASDASLPGSAPTRRKPRPQQWLKSKSHVPPSLQADDTWFGQTMRNASRAVRPQKRPRQQVGPFFPADDTLNAQRSLVLPAAERLVGTRLASENNTDIRDFFGGSRRAPAGLNPSVHTRHAESQHDEAHPGSCAGNGGAMQVSSHRPRSADSYHHSTSTAQEMDALFQLHQHASPGLGLSPVRRSRPLRNTSFPVTRSASRPRRCCTADGGLHRTKSSTFPLNFTPHSFEIRNLTLPMTTSVSSIVHQARKLDMGANTLEWGYDSTNAFDVFVTAIHERRVMQWVMEVDSLLAGVFERRDGVEVRGALHEGIQRFLDARQNKNHDADECGVEITEKLLLVGGPGLDEAAHAEGRSGNDAYDLETGAADAGATMDADGSEADFGFGQFIDFDGGGEQIFKLEGDGSDDEMLMDL